MTAGPAALFAALGDQTRLRIVQRLVEGGSLSIADIAREEKVTRQAITKHLLVLEGAGVVTDSRRGRERLWRLEAAQLEEAGRYLDQVSRQWDGALERLRRAVET